MNQDNKIKIIYRIPSSSRPNLIDQKRRLNSVRVNFRFRRSTRRVIWSYFGKHIADLFTFLRLILGLVLLWSGLVDRKAALAQDIWTLVLAWSTDMVDGRISRSLRQITRPGWARTTYTWTCSFLWQSFVIWVQPTCCPLRS